MSIDRMIANNQTIDEPSVDSPYREASRRYLEIISKSMDYIASSTSPQNAVYHVILALGLPCGEGRSLTYRAEHLGCSVGALSKGVRTVQRLLEVDESLYCYKK